VLLSAVLGAAHRASPQRIVYAIALSPNGDIGSYHIIDVITLLPCRWRWGRSW
jgi:hypothetical protein